MGDIGDIEFPLEKQTHRMSRRNPIIFVGKPRYPQAFNFRSGTSRNASPRNRSGPPSSRGPGPPLPMVTTSNLDLWISVDVPTDSNIPTIWGQSGHGSGPGRERANATLYPRVRIFAIGDLDQMIQLLFTGHPVFLATFM